MVSPLVEANSTSLGGWTSTVEGIDVVAGEVVSLRLADSAGVKHWSFSISSTDDQIELLGTEPALTVDLNAKTASFTAPTSPSDGWCIVFESIVGVGNLGMDANFAVQSSYTARFSVHLLTSAGLRVGAADETLASSSSHGWLEKLNDAIRHPPGSGGPPTGAAGGDLGATYPNPSVLKARGATIGTAAGALVVGTVLRVTGASTIDYGAVNLASSSAVTGTLALANFTAGTNGQVLATTAGVPAWATAAGDVTGAPSAFVVGRIKGTTVTTAGGALTTGHVLRVTGAATSDWGTLSAAASLSPGTANQFLVTNSGGTAPAWTSSAGDWTGSVAANVVGKINGATVPASGSLTTGHVLQVSGAAALTYALLSATASISPGGADKVFVTNTANSSTAWVTQAGDVSGKVDANAVVRLTGNAGVVDALKTTISWTTNNAVSADTHLKYQPTEAGSSKWIQGSHEFPNAGSARNNHVYTMGWNLSPGPSRLVSGAETAMGLGFESYYNPGGGIEYMEYHTYFVTSADVQKRPMSRNFHRATNVVAGGIFADRFDFGPSVGLPTTVIIGSASSGTGSFQLGDNHQVQLIAGYNNAAFIYQLNGALNAYVEILYVDNTDTIRIAPGGVATRIGGTLTVNGASATIGTNPAASGAIRIANNVTISARNAANNADLVLWKANASNLLETGLLGTGFVSATSGVLSVGTTIPAGSVAPGTNGQVYVTAGGASTWATPAGDWSGAITATVVVALTGTAGDVAMHGTKILWDTNGPSVETSSGDLLLRVNTTGKGIILQDTTHPLGTWSWGAGDTIYQVAGGASSFSIAADSGTGLAMVLRVSGTSPAGIFFASDFLTFRQSNNTNKGVWTGTGLRVGDASSPTRAFEVLGDAAVSGSGTFNEAGVDVVARSYTANASYAGLYIGVTPGTNNFALISDGSEVVLNAPGTTLRFAVGGANHGTLTTTGFRVGDGTSPAERFEVNGNAKILNSAGSAFTTIRAYTADSSLSAIYMGGVTPGSTNYAILSDANTLITNAASALSFRIANGSKMHVTTTGLRVGDGSSPTVALDVLGDAKVTGIGTFNEAAVDVILRGYTANANYAGMYVGVTPGTNNFALISDGSELLLNAPATTLRFTIAATNHGTWTTTGLRVGDGTNPAERLEAVGNILATGSVILGTTPATAGGLRIPNNVYISARNAANNANLDLWKANASNQIETGIATVTTANTEFVYEQTGDTSGASRLRMRNRSGTQGAMLENGALDVIDLRFSGSTVASNIRLEGRGGSVFLSATEFQIGVAGAPTLVVGNTTDGVQVRSANLRFSGAGTLGAGGALILNAASGNAVVTSINAVTHFEITPSGLTSYYPGTTNMAIQTRILSSQHVAALGRMANLTGTQFPASVGDGVIYVGNAATIPNGVATVDGHVYLSANIGGSGAYPMWQDSAGNRFLLENVSVTSAIDSGGSVAVPANCRGLITFYRNGNRFGFPYFQA